MEQRIKGNVITRDIDAVLAAVPIVGAVRFDLHPYNNGDLQTEQWCIGADGFT